VTIDGVELGASLAPGTISRLASDQISVGLSSVDARPQVASWVFDQIPAIRGFGYWAGRRQCAVAWMASAYWMPTVPIWCRPLPALWQPDAAAGPPLTGTVPDGWGIDRAADYTVLLISPPAHLGSVPRRTADLAAVGDGTSVAWPAAGRPGP